MSPKLTAWVAGIVTVIWAASMIYNAVNQDYNPPAPIHGAFMLIIGGIFGARLAGKDG